MSKLWRRFVGVNSALSGWSDRLFSRSLRIDGNTNFREDFAKRFLKPGSRVYDVGGGKQPFLAPGVRQALKMTVIGVDISADELSLAPSGAYDHTIVADIEKFAGCQDADFVICQAVLEHVADVAAAIASVASILKPGGLLIAFVPCRNAAFARLNLVLPEKLKRRILFSIFPSAKDAQGFVSHYDRCTPSALRSIAARYSLVQLDVRHYYMSGYFTFFWPLFIIWRLWTALVYVLGRKDLCETFSMALVKETGPLGHSC